MNHAWHQSLHDRGVGQAYQANSPVKGHFSTHQVEAQAVRVEHTGPTTHTLAASMAASMREQK